MLYGFGPQRGTGARGRRELGAREQRSAIPAGRRAEMKAGAAEDWRVVVEQRRVLSS
jgi:hypothetical protein